MWAAIWIGIQAVGHVLSIIGSAVAATFEAAIIYLLRGLGWLSGHVGLFLESTGSMFAKAWELTRALYANVLKPALVWLHDAYTKVKTWLGKWLAPVFTFLNRVRAELLLAYRRYLQPFLEVIDVTRAVLRTLADLHVPFAQALDRRLAQLESIVGENFLRLLGETNKVINVLNGVVDGTLLFRRSPFLLTLERDSRFWVRIWWNKSIAPIDHVALEQKKARTMTVDQPANYGAALAAYYRGEDSPIKGYADELVPLWKQSAGT